MCHVDGDFTGTLKVGERRRESGCGLKIELSGQLETASIGEGRNLKNRYHRVLLPREFDPIKARLEKYDIVIRYVKP